MKKGKYVSITQDLLSELNQCREDDRSSRNQIFQILAIVSTFCAVIAAISGSNSNILINDMSFYLTIGIRKPLRHSSKKSGWHLTPSLLVSVQNSWKNGTKSAFQKQSKFWRRGWRILWRFTLFQSWIPAKFPPPICWSA